MSRTGTLRHWIEFQTRDSAEAADAGATITYTKVVQVRANIRNRSGYEMVNGRGAATESTHSIEVRNIPSIDKTIYVLALNGPFAGLRLKLDTASRPERLGRRLTVRGYIVSGKGTFVQPSKGNLPELLS